MNRRAVTGAILAVVFASAADAEIRRCMSGVVKDGQGAPLPGAIVTVTSAAILEGQRRCVTDAMGIFRFPTLPPGTYTIAAELFGFERAVRDGYVVSPVFASPLQIVMRMEARNVSIQVCGPMGHDTLRTDTSQVSVQLHRVLTDNLPGG